MMTKGKKTTEGFACGLNLSTSHYPTVSPRWYYPDRVSGIFSANYLSTPRHLHNEKYCIKQNMSISKIA